MRCSLRLLLMPRLWDGSNAKHCVASHSDAYSS